MPKAKGSKIEISLTDFVDFVCKAGSSKLTKVKQVKNREEYSPATDFYKALREGIKKNHESDGERKDLKKILDKVTDNKKIKNYSEAIDGYRKFWGNKTFKYFSPPSKHWVKGDLDIRINPELGLEYNGNFIIVKLYLKSDKLGKDKIEQILTLMESQLRKGFDKEIKMAVLDVKNGKLFLKENDDVSLFPLLEGEAISFETIWKGIK